MAMLPSRIIAREDITALQAIFDFAELECEIFYVA